METAGIRSYSPNLELNLKIYTLSPKHLVQGPRFRFS